MPLFRFDLPARAEELEGLTVEQVGVWYFLVLETWARGPITWEDVVHLVEQKRTLSQDPKRTLSAEAMNGPESERFLLEELAPNRWGFSWLEEHRERQEEKSHKAQLSGKAGGRGNTPRRKAAKVKANAFSASKSERFPEPQSERFPEPSNEPEKRTLSAVKLEPKSERFPEADKGARTRERAQLSPVLFSEEEQVVEREERETRARLFRNSGWSEAEWLKEFTREDLANVDVLHYFHAVSNWSDMNEKKKRSKRGWLATGKSWMRNDLAAGKLKMKRTPEMIARTKENALDYLTLGK